MQTFLPYSSFLKSASVLDRQRLGKQRVECKQLLMALSGERGGWRNHPAAKMWAGYELALATYGAAICAEWIRRGYKDSLLPYFEQAVATLPAPANGAPPPWLGDETFHASHRSNLLRKLPAHYRAFWPDEPDNLPYVWPSAS